MAAMPPMLLLRVAVAHALVLCSHAAVDHPLHHSTAAVRPPLRLFVDPLRGADTPAHGFESADGALRSLGAASARLERVLGQDPQRDVVVELAAGSHRVPDGGLRLTAAHSPADGRSVLWRGSAAGGTSVTGGSPVSGWKKLGDPALPAAVYAAPAPALPASSGGAARHLYVDGVRAVRTRVNITNPNGRQSPAGAAELPRMSLESHRADCPACSYAVNSTGPLRWDNPMDVEFVYPVGMSEPRCTVEQVVAGNLSSGTAARIVMKQPCFHNLVNRDWQPVGSILPVWIENVRAHLNAPGQFYHDRKKQQLLYYPLPGQDMAAASAMLAVEEVLVQHTAAQHHIWSNLSFEYATWLRPMQGEGFVEQQAAACDQCPYGVANKTHRGAGCGLNDVYVSTPGNVQVVASHDVAFEGCSFQHLGAFGASATNGSQGVAWRRCSFTDISGGAIWLGGTDTWNCNGGDSSVTTPVPCTAADPSSADRNYTIEDCEITNIPAEFGGASALFAGYVSDTLIQHNLIVNTTYSGITLGWGWGREGGGVGNNHVLANKLERVMTDYCCDGGAIYTLGPQPGSSVSRNHIVQPFRDDWPYPRQPCITNKSKHNPTNPPGGLGNYSGCGGKGIYHDNGSGGFNDTANVIDGAWNRFITVNSPWTGGVLAYGPGENSADKPAPKTKGRNLCPGPDGVTDHDCRVNITGNWIRMVELAGNGNGASCDGVYAGLGQVNTSCWLNHDNWMNGQDQPTWINHSNGYVAPTDYHAPFPADALAVIAAAGPRPA